MIGVDRHLQSFAGFWADLNLWGASGPLRNFSYGTYSIRTKKLQPVSDLTSDLKSHLMVELKKRQQEIEGGIERIELDGATIFTVPIGQGAIACFIFDRTDTEFFTPSSLVVP